MALSAAERAELCLVARSGMAPARRVLRAEILLKADANSQACTDEEIADALAIGLATVRRVRARYLAEEARALERRPQPSRPAKRKLDGRGEAQADDAGLFCSARRTPALEAGQPYRDMVRELGEELPSVAAIHAELRRVFRWLPGAGHRV